jgi:NADPH:quinone reductase-like Zn-dependent oxidoreductase
MEKGDVLGHEFMGEVVEVGKSVRRLKRGDRVVVPFPHRLRALLVLSKTESSAAATTPTRTPS